MAFSSSLFWNFHISGRVLSFAGFVDQMYLRLRYFLSRTTSRVWTMREVDKRWYQQNL